MRGSVGPEYSVHAVFRVARREGGRAIALPGRCNGIGRSKTQSVTVLIVDDDQLVSVFLEAEGFVVYEANAAAVRSLELRDEISLVCTDINMPGWMNGLALAHYIRGRWPPVKIIDTSGDVNGRHRACLRRLYSVRSRMIRRT